MKSTGGLLVIWRYALLFMYGILLMAVLRAVFIFRYGDLQLIAEEHMGDLFTAFWVGARFDGMILSYAFLPIFLLYLIGRFVPKIRESVWRIPYTYLLYVMPLLLFVALADQQYYFFFQHHFNVLMFGLMDDDTGAVLTSVWTDHPIVKLFLVIAVFVWLNRKIVRWISSVKIRPYKAIPSFFIGLLFVPAYGMAFRGSVGIFPIQEDDASFSVYRFLNVSSVNAFYSFKLALREYKKSMKVRTQQELNKKFGFQDLNEAYAVLTGSDAGSTNMNELLFRTTDKNPYLEKKPPHVVVLLMEGMGRHFADLHSEKVNTLGRLEKHFKEDYLFTRFLSGENGTMYSIEDMVTSCPMHVIAQSPYKYHAFDSSVSQMFKDKGYETMFAFGGKTSWRNLEDFLKVQGFQYVAGQAELLREYAQASKCEWGVHDEHLLDYVWEHLNDHKDRPQFVFSMSISNHTPFDLPETHPATALHLSDSVKGRIKSAQEFAEKNIRTYQYASDHVGAFLDKLKASDLAENTIVVLTGDHNNWLVFDYPGEEIQHKYAVPLYFYIPEEYKGAMHFDANRIGSFKDIFPTIAKRALSESSYFGLGNDLFAPQEDSLWYFAANGRRNFMTDGGMMLYQKNYRSHESLPLFESDAEAATQFDQDEKLYDRRFRAYMYLVNSYFHKELREAKE